MALGNHLFVSLISSIFYFCEYGSVFSVSGDKKNMFKLNYLSVVPMNFDWGTNVIQKCKYDLLEKSRTSLSTALVMGKCQNQLANLQRSN